MKYTLATLAADELARDARRVSGVHARRDEAIAVIAVAIRKQADQRQRRNRVAVGVSLFTTLAVAAAVILVIDARRTPPREMAAVAVVAVVAPSAAPSPVASLTPLAGAARLEVRGRVVRSSEDGTPLPATETLTVGDLLAVEDGEATIAFTQGSRITSHAAAKLRVDSVAPEMRVQLLHGTVDADVVPLVSGQRFVIRTDDEAIEVHGTSFTVEAGTPEASCAPGIRTRVRVREGVVAIQSGAGTALVRAGETWPSGCSESAAGPAASAPIEPTARSSARLAPTAAVQRPAVPSHASELAAENDLYARAMQQKNAGDAPGAIATFDVLLRRFPTSHLAHASRAERMRLLRGVDRERARSAAREYLALHPNGFARSDAETLLAAP